MNVERQLIGSLLIDGTRYDEVSWLTSNMFTDTLMADIYSIFESGEEVNPFVITQKITYFPDIEETLQALVIEHDASISDKTLANEIFNNYKAKGLNEYMDHQRITAQNVDSVSGELENLIDSFHKDDDVEIKTLAELTAYKDNYFSPKNEKQLKIGFEKIDRAIGGFDAGDVTIIAARPAVGKSALALQIIRKFGRDGAKVGYFNLEMALKQIYERSVASTSGIDLSRIRLGTNFLNNEKRLFDEGNTKLSEENNVYTITGRSLTVINCLGMS